MCGNIKYGIIAVIAVRVIQEIKAPDMSGHIHACVHWKVPEPIVDQHSSTGFVKYPAENKLNTLILVDPLNQKWQVTKIDHELEDAPFGSKHDTMNWVEYISDKPCNTSSDTEQFIYGKWDIKIKFKLDRMVVDISADRFAEFLWVTVNPAPTGFKASLFYIQSDKHQLLVSEPVYATQHIEFKLDFASATALRVDCKLCVPVLMEGWLHWASAVVETWKIH